MIIIAKAFDKPIVTVVILTIVGLTGLVLQAIYEWYPSFVLSEILFLAFACVAVYAGSIISFRVLPRLHKLDEHVISSSKGKKVPNLPLRIEKHQWIALGVLGVLVGLAALLTHDVAGIPWAGFSRFVYFVSIFINFGVVGTVLGLYGLALIWLLYLSKREVSIKPYGWQPEIVAETANVYLLITFFGVGLYLLGLFAIWESPGGRLFFAEGNPVRQFWILPLAIGIAGYLCLTQFLIQRIVYNVKASRLVYLRSRKDKAFNRWEETRRTDDAEVVNFLTGTIHDVMKEGTWQLNIPKLLSVLIPIFVPASKEIVKIFTIIFGG